MASPTNYRKFLKVFGIIEIVIGVLSLIGALLSFASAGVLSGQTAEIDGAAVDAGVAAIALGVIIIITGISSIVEGIASLRLAKDPSRTISYFFVVASAVLALLSGISSMLRTGFNGASSALTLLSCVLINGLIVYAAVKVRGERESA